MKKVQKPEQGEYAPHAIMYIDLVPEKSPALPYAL
jgi:hypothetical protein